MLLKCIKQARKMNHTMLADLRARTEGWADRIEVSDIFVHFAAVCPQTYGGYARSHARTIETLGSEVFAEFKHAYREETGEPMATTLIKPVQWVVRVLLLLKDLQKKTGEAHSDHAGLAESISAMEKSCNTVNHFVWVRENKQKNLALQKQARVAGASPWGLLNVGGGGQTDTHTPPAALALRSRVLTLCHAAVACRSWACRRSWRW